MARVTWLLAATSVAGVATSVWLYLDNRALRAHEPAPAAASREVAARAADPWIEPARAPAPSSARAAAVAPPALPAPKEESRLEKRNRRMQEFAALFGRGENESADDYRARIVPLIKAGLAVPRERVDEMRKLAEAQAHVTPAQSQKLDRAFDKVYADTLDYTNKAIADGQLSPYERNVSGWLQYAGGLGTMLDEAQGQIAQILAPDQVRALTDSGFEWGEYFAVEAPWEKLDPPPPPKPR